MPGTAAGSAVHPVIARLANDAIINILKKDTAKSAFIVFLHFFGNSYNKARKEAAALPVKLAKGTLI